MTYYVLRTVAAYKTLTQSLVQYCCSTATVLLWYCYGMAGVRFSSVWLETAIHYVYSIYCSCARVSGMQLMWSLMSIVRNEQTLIPSLASF